jgi:FHA domain
MKVESLSADVLMPLAAGAAAHLAANLAPESSAADDRPSLEDHRALVPESLTRWDRSADGTPIGNSSGALTATPDLLAVDGSVENVAAEPIEDAATEDAADDAELCRSTYVMGMVEESSQDIDIPSAKASPRYVQGVIRGHQAYMITNLVGETSKTLLQPQMLWTLGRNREAALAIKDRMMSRRHAVILYDRQDECFYVADLGSLNGSYLNGVRLKQRQKLQDGDFLRVGNTEFFFFSSGTYESLDALPPEDYAKLSQDYGLLGN